MNLITGISTNLALKLELVLEFSYGRNLHRSKD